MRSYGPTPPVQDEEVKPETLDMTFSMPQRKSVPDPGRNCLEFFLNKFSFPHSSCYTPGWKKVPTFLETKDSFGSEAHKSQRTQPGRMEDATQDSLVSRNGGQDGRGNGSRSLECSTGMVLSPQELQNED